jgi:hypothetical protein
LIECRMNVTCVAVAAWSGTFRGVNVTCVAVAAWSGTFRGVNETRDGGRRTEVDRIQRKENGTIGSQFP